MAPIKLTAAKIAARMNVVESITAITTMDVRARLQCGHTVIVDASVKPGQKAYCPECEAYAMQLRTQVAVLLTACTPEQLRAVADEYAQAMIEMGVPIGPPERELILRAARIQDTWRVAFKKVLE